MTPDLSTSYMGLPLANPIVVSACPLTKKPDTLKRLEDAGAAAAVFPSLFEEQIEHEELELFRLHATGADSFLEAATYLPELDSYNVGPDAYLEQLEQARKNASIPIIGSLNGSTNGGWVRYAKLIEETGASALELNVFFVPTDPAMTAKQVEDQYLELVAEVRAAVSIPLAVKVVPYFSAFANMAKRLAECGAEGLVLFNRIVPPDIDLERLAVVPDLVLSRSYSARVSLTWIALLRGRVPVSLAASSGVHTHEDVMKLLLAGADITMTASSLYMHGPGHIGVMLDGVREWMRENEYDSVEQLKGSLSQEHSPDPSAFERVNYMRTLMTFSGGTE